ncbi:MAG: mechanosensitive ion channel family protein, partial [Candidatus Cloacimonetes bacterium]|nr:mechanosensitive ion channel family protein [Candidatus Cloacimonadota bacterium]
MIDFKEIWSKIVEHVLLYGPQLVTAILTLIIGLWIINTMMKVLFK